MEMVHAYHAVENSAPRTPVPQAERAAGRLTLFQQPWTGKPSSPCGEEGSTWLRLSGRPIEQAGRGNRPHTVVAGQDPAPACSCLFLFYSYFLLVKALEGGRKQVHL